MASILNIFSGLPGLILAIVLLVNLALAYVVYRNDPRSATNIIFALLSIAISAWLVVINRASSPADLSVILLYTRLTVFLAVPQSVLFFLLSHTVPDETMSFKRHFFLFTMVGMGIIMGLTLSPAVFSNVQITGDTIKSIPGSGMPFFAVFVVFYSIAAIYTLVKKIRHASGEIRRQLLFMMEGILLMLGLIIVTIMVPIIFFQNQMFIPFSPLYVLIFLGMTAYAIVKHHLFDVKVIATEAFAVILWIMLGSRLLVSGSWNEFLINGLIFVATIIFGIFLIRSVRREVQQREELKIANVKLQEADRMKSQFLSFASHQVKSPMTVVKDYADLIRDGNYGAIPDKVKETATKIHDSAERLIKLVNDLLDLRKIEEGKIEYIFINVDLAALLKNICEEFKTLADAKHLAMTWEIPAEPIMAKIDESKLRQVFQNLLDNAIKYTESGWVKIQIIHQQSKIIIKISDTGLGIPKELLPSLFEQFERGSKEAKKIQGTGLGLYIAKQFVLAHHGTVVAASDGPGKGSTFTVTLPYEDTHH